MPSARAGRYTPDIAFSAAGHDGYFACFAAAGASCVSNSNGAFSFEYFYGTSAAAPSMAGIAALLDEKEGEANGNLNPQLYKMASSSPTAFHDVTVATSGVSGCTVTTPSMCNNSIPGPTGLSGGQPGYLVTSGYDEVTGLGSLDVANFLNGFAAPVYTPKVYVSTNLPGVTTAQTLYVSVGITGRDGITPTGTVVLTSGSYTSGSQTLDQGGTIFEVLAGNLVAGTETLTVNYAPDAASSSVYGSTSGATTVVVTSVPIIAPIIGVEPSPTNPTTAQAVQIAVYVNGNLGPDGHPNQNPTGTIILSGTGFSSGPVKIDSSSNNGTSAAIVSVPAQVLSVGTDTFTASYTPDATSSKIYNSATGTGSVTVTAAVPIAPRISLGLPNPPFYLNQPLLVSVGLQVDPGSLLPTGTVNLTSGAYSSKAISLVNGGANIDIPAGTLPLGSDILTVTYTPDSASSAIYLGASASTTVDVTTAPVPAISISGTAVTVTAGATTGNTSTITVTPAGGFTGSVVLSAAITSSPTGAVYAPTVGFGSTSPVNITNANNGTATLTVATTAATTASLNPIRRSFPWLPAGGVTLACVLLLGIPARRLCWRGMTGMAVLLIAMAGGLIACGGGGSSGGGGNQGHAGTTAGAYTITVTATSASLTSTTTVTLTVR